jgi:hypothetical protein
VHCGIASVLSDLEAHRDEFDNGCTGADQQKDKRGMRRASSLLGGALLGMSIMTPVLAGGDPVEGDAFVIFLSCVLALVGIGMHVTGSAGHALAKTASTRFPIRSRRAFASRTRA